MALLPDCVADELLDMDPFRVGRWESEVFGGQRQAFAACYICA